MFFCFKAFAKSFNKTSPAAWPYVSLIYFKPLLSKNRKASIFKTSDYILKLKSKVDKLEGLDILELADYLNTSTENILIAKNLNNEIISFNIFEIEPILNPLWVAVFYHEVITPLSLVGAIIVIVAIVGYNVWKAVKVST